jgi:hypothetical protein
VLSFGSMVNGVKGRDLDRDPRFALHGPTFHPVEGKESEWPGEAKIAGVARRVGDEAFEGDIESVAITCLNPEATRLVVEWWTPAAGRQRIERD